MMMFIFSRSRRLSWMMRSRIASQFRLRAKLSSVMKAPHALRRVRANQLFDVVGAAIT